MVHEERRLRTDSTPTGKFNEQYDSMFWQSSPYGWPVVGWPSDLEGITREEALEYFAVNYAPNNLTAALVGDVDPARAIELARNTLARLPRGPRPPEPVRTSEMPQLAEKRMVAYAETNPQVRVRYHTVAEGHPDAFRARHPRQCAERSHRTALQVAGAAAASRQQRRRRPGLAQV